MSKTVSVEQHNSLLSMYEAACLEFYKNSNEANLQAVVEAEHNCVHARIRRSELTKIRFTAMNAAEEMSNEV